MSPDDDLADDLPEDRIELPGGQDETPWYRSLLVGVGALLGTALLVGAIIGLVAVGALSVVGLGGDDSPSAEEAPSLYIPVRTGPTGEDEGPGLTLEDLNGGASPSASRTGSAESADSAEERREARRERRQRRQELRSRISLSASPVQVLPMERIYLSGTYPAGEGRSLQVQRFEDGWTDFPVSTSVSGGTFNTYVVTGRTGPNRFRVVDPATGRASNPVSVRIG